MSALRRIPISLPCTGPEELEAVRGPLESGWLTQGPRVAEFETAFAARHGVESALAVTSCTTGLHLILAALGVGPGDEVIVPAFTWVASANVVRHCGATPVLADVDPATCNLRPDEVARRLTPRTRAVVAVHLFGLCSDMDALAAAAPGVPLIEDAACAAGASYKGRPAGSLGLAAAFSFHPRKIITTGEGGMVTTQDPALARRMESLRNHGAAVSEEERHGGPRPYLLPEFREFGFNYRMTDLQGAVGLAQLAKLDSLVAQRRDMAAQYAAALADIPWLRTPAPPDWAGHSYQAYVCVVDEARAPRPRNALMEQLLRRGVGTRPGTHAVHMLAAYGQAYGLRPEDFPAARDLDRYSMAIPLHNRMDREDLEYVVQALHDLG